MGVSEQDTTALDAFAAAYVRRVAAQPAQPAEAALDAEIRGAFELVDGRPEGAVAVRAFTPLRERDGYEPGSSVLETNGPDHPFLVDSVTAELKRRGIGVRRVAHPIIGCRRGADGRVVEVLHPREAPRESVMHFELDRRLDPGELADLEDAVRAILNDVQRVVRDHHAMLDRVDRMAEHARAAAGTYPDDEIEDTVGFLGWLADEHFVFLGAREYAIRDGAWTIVDASGLGLLDDPARSRYATPVPLDDLTPSLRLRATSGDLLIVSKTNRLATVHRRRPMDYVGVRTLDADGNVAGESRLIGLFTTRAYAEPASATPLLRRKLAQILAHEDLVEGSHDYKEAVRIFDTFPKDELFAAGTEDLRGAIVALLSLGTDTVRLLGRRAEDGRTASLIAALPRERYDATLQRGLHDLLVDRFRTTLIEVHEVFDEQDRVRQHIIVHSPDGAELPEVSDSDLEAELEALARTWGDRVVERLVADHGDERGRVLAARWLRRLPESYRAATDPVHAAGDIAGLERLAVAGRDLEIGLQEEDGRTRVAFLRRGPKVELHQATRLLEDLGLRVIEERPAPVEGDEEHWVQAFGVLGAHDRPLDLMEVRARVAASITACWRGEAESDSLQRLVVSAGLDARQVQILRAYRRYRQRIGSRYTESYQNDVIAAHPEITRRLIELFEMRFDPSRPRDVEGEERVRHEILAELDAIPLLDHDRILRNQLGLIDATLRTSAYRPGAAAMAFKIRSADVPAMPPPPPFVEIYVYGREVEGVHLRGGMIARGGLRWSERMDYRTEVLGLQRAQMTKNAVIVPTGAKGGFLLRGAPSDPAALRDAVRRAYVTYIEALLDLTDDLRDGEVVHPDGVRVLDGEDTYLVVAADKGTATFSDTANEIAVRRGFWLGDAFASGGSTGYDHKALGITARGAWEAVRRHFRALGVDPESDNYTVAGIGDMSGDVFGNGMLLSKSMRLVAAYDHRHVFIDPHPADPERSWEERRRLFELPGSSWDDYDRALVSAGGGVWPRTAKSITLPPEAREVLGLEADDGPLAPTEVIQAILRAPVDLLFNGGIGTVVKASTESDADARDRSSDAIRVDAADLRCRVVAEGGNLGLTQRARIEFARRGGLVHADFIDNSAGVDCSDHEVNLKILLELAKRRGELGEDARVALLREVTDDVTRHVLYDCFAQAQILAIESGRSAGRLDAYEDLMTELEEDRSLDRDAEGLPGAEELGERRRAGEGLSRPELAVLLAYAKRSLIGAVLDSPLVDDPALAAEIEAYFPPQVVARFGHLVPEHPLRRELIATLVANDVVNTLGPTYVSRMVAERGASPPEAVRAYRIASGVTGAVARRRAVEALDGEVSHDTYLRLLRGIDALVSSTARWYLAHPVPGTLDEAIAADRDGFDRLVAILPSLRSDAWRRDAEAKADQLVADGVPPALARAHAMQPALVHAPDVVAVAAASGRDINDVAAAFFGLGERLRLEWIERQIDELATPGRLARWAAAAVRDDVLSARRELAHCALLEAPGATPEDAVEQFLAARADRRERLQGFTRALALEGAADLAGLTLAVRQLRALV